MPIPTLTWQPTTKEGGNHKPEGDPITAIARLAENLFGCPDIGTALAQTGRALPRIFPGALTIVAPSPPVLPPSRTSVTSPVEVDGEVVAWLGIAAPSLSADPCLETTLHAIASMVRAALSCMRQRERLTDEARRDALTGLYNRRYLDERLDAEVDRARRHDRPLGLVMVDVDDFKRFNRDFGHAVGDAVLVAVAHALRRSLRASDIICRRGGDELVIILPEATAVAAGQRARSVVRTVSRQLPRIVEGGLPPITISAGAAGFPDDARDPASLMLRADEALRRSKSQGKQRATSSGSWPRPEGA